MKKKTLAEIAKQSIIIEVKHTIKLKGGHLGSMGANNRYADF